MAANPTTVPTGEKPVERWETNGDIIGDKSQGFQKENQPFFLDLVNLEKLFLQTIPFELDVDPGTNWAVLNSMGRNAAGLQYTGAGDTLTFELSWYSDHDSREDVIRKCKWIEALSKADGYKAEPHDVLFVWGGLFIDSTYKVISAPYILKLFNREYLMLPQQAIQTITLRKVCSVNPTRSDILKVGT